MQLYSCKSKKKVVVVVQKLNSFTFKGIFFERENHLGMFIFHVFDYKKARGALIKKSSRLKMTTK